VHSHQLSFSYLQFVTHILYYTTAINMIDGFTSCLVAKYGFLVGNYGLTRMLYYLFAGVIPYPLLTRYAIHWFKIILLQSHMNGWFQCNSSLNVFLCPIPVPPDPDPCDSNSTNPCSAVGAYCSTVNTLPGETVRCTCLTGFVGDGRTCTGEKRKGGEEGRTGEEGREGGREGGIEGGREEGGGWRCGVCTEP